MKIMVKKGLLCIIILFFIGCVDLRSRAVGDLNEIIVCADLEVLEETENILEVIFEKELKTPQPEKIFYLTKINPLQFVDYQKFRHIILLGTLNGNGEISNYIKSLLDDRMKNGMREGRYFYLIKKDEFSIGQLMIILVAENLSILKKKISDNKGFIFNQFDNAINRSVTRSMFGIKENKKLEDKLFKTYGWTLRMQPDYIIAKEDSGGNFVWLRRFNPDRMISVYWKDSEDGDELDENWAVERRAFIGKKYLDGMKINEDYTKTEMTDFLGRNAVKVEGLWEIEEIIIGGFFRSYAFFDKKTKRIYLIDLAVFAPDSVKEPFIRQLDIIAHTFSTSPLKSLRRGIF